MALPSWGQKGRGRPGGQVVGRQVSDASEDHQEYDTGSGGVEVFPEIGQLRHSHQELPSQ